MAPTDGSSSISVTVRVRPFTIREAAQLTKSDEGPLFLGDGSLAGVPSTRLAQKGIRPVIKVVDDKCLVFDPPEDNPIQKFSRQVLPQGKRTKDQTFAFDRVFDDNTTQDDVYEATTKGLLDSVLDGYNATVFAYGATGCGKTHTITGTSAQPGIIFLTMQELFERIGETEAEKVTDITLSYLEIYNETIRDLLVEPGTAVNKSGLMLREDANQAVSVAGLSSHRPHNVPEVMDMIMRGNDNRTVSPTEANATSSRSHAVLQINISQKDRNAAVNEPHTMATLSIIDLAGSERASATKNRGDRLMEGANINKSLLALGSCINALCDPRKHNHIPYRNSKLTRLLKFSLGGNCKTVMIVCVSPSSQHFDETQNTLRYANRAKNIQTKVTRNVFNVNRHVKDFLRKIDEQMNMINELKEQQKDYEGVAFAKFKKQTEKRDGILRDGIGRLRAAYEHSLAERQERLNNVKRLRQLEKRISMINSWIAAFDTVCEIRDEEEPPQGLAAMKKTAQGILAELEQSRHHYHQRIGKNNWQRALDTALQVGFKALQEVDPNIDASESDSLAREAELLKANAERDLHLAVIEQDKPGDSSLVQVLLQAHFETVAIISQILSMDETEAVQAAKTVLHKMLTSCTDATGHVIRPDGSMPITAACPPSRSGTPKRKKAAKLFGPSASPAVPMRLAAVLEEERPSAPAFSSPVKIREFKVGSAKKMRPTPRKKSPSKRAVRWRDDDEGKTLQDYSKTPTRLEEGSPAEDMTGDVTTPALPEFLPKRQEYSPSPMGPPPPIISTDLRPVSGRFQAGFLSRKNESPQLPTLTQLSSSPEPSPLSEMTNNRASGRLSTEMFRKPLVTQRPSSRDENSGNISSDSDSTWTAGREDAKKIGSVMRRKSLSRASSIRESNGKTYRRRSGSPPADASSSLFSSSQARRMGVKADNEWGARGFSVLSPRINSTPVMKPTHRRTTMSLAMMDDRTAPRSISRPGHSRASSVQGGSIGSSRPSIQGGSVKNIWR